MRLIRHVWLGAAYYLSWLLFGLGGVVLNLGSAPLLLFGTRRDALFGHTARAAIRQMFSFWLRWMHGSGVMNVHMHELDQPGLAVGTVYVANHPTLVDAPFLLGRLPDAICIFKPALLRNPVIAPVAVLAGYVAGDNGVDVIREAAALVAAGRSLLIFPEGTRTLPGTLLNPLKPGFALIAERARAPIQIITVRASPDVVPKGRAWWKLPQLPGRFDFHLDERIAADDPRDAHERAAYVAARLSTVAGQPWP